MPPEFVSEEEWRHWRKMKEVVKEPMQAFCRIGCGFGGDWMGGFARSKDKTCYAATSKRSLMKQLPYIKNVEFRYGLYDSHKPEGMVIYCDPPYANTTQYGAFKGFDSAKFWQTVREWSANNTVLVSEYVAPDDFECIAEFSSRMGLTADGERGIRVERVFKYKG